MIGLWIQTQKVIYRAENPFGYNFNREKELTK